MHQYTVDYWGSNLLDLFSGGESSRKGSATNLHPSGENLYYQSQHGVLN
jgi:hypothetical protein